MTALEIFLVLDAVERGEGKRIPLSRYQRWFLVKLARALREDVRNCVGEPLFDLGEVNLRFTNEEVIALIGRLRRIQHWKER